jgi:hypothetical protein
VLSKINATDYNSQWLTLAAVRYDIAQGLTAPQKTQARQNIAAPLRGWIAGLTLSAAGASATFGIAAGEAADSTSAELMQLASAYTKTTGAWAVGTAAGALDIGAIAAAAWYHVYLIRRPDTGVIDICVSLSATTPNLTTGNIPTAYTQFRRIGSMLTVASQWRKFNQRGDEFLWDARVQDVSAAGWSTTAVLVTLSVPTGVQVNALFSARANYTTNAGLITFYSPDESDQAPGSGQASLVASASASSQGGHFNIRSNIAGQIRHRANNTVSTVDIATYGWIDQRGKDA